MKPTKLDEPLNATERYLYACAVRLDALCDMVSSLIEHIAKQNGVATTTNVIEDKMAIVQEEVKPKTRRKKAGASE